ncbi:MAG: hypothetical protein Q8K93_26070 [Reyranella sp.]|uniref:hypothetical protein n=1 Tax=Reyranella sp. TaxID=1929291 RepID=UPI0027301698|nr:hypothetical protein [Reyranella sp.]MDP1965661.1 hypothetical protein [Reyranella sp.]MDP2372600.1 hypothetical protein [Reyranella sp.]
MKRASPPFRSAALLACLWAAPVVHAETIALRCPMISVAAEFIYDIDLAAKTVQLANVGESRTLPVTVDATFVTWSDPPAGVLYRLTRGSGELMTASTAVGPWEMMSFCVPRRGI